MLLWQGSIVEIDYGFFRVFGPYFIGKSLGTFKILIFGLWSFIPHPYLVVKMSAYLFIYIYGTKCVERIVTKSMSNLFYLCDFSVPYCATLEAGNWFVAGQHLDRFPTASAEFRRNSEAGLGTPQIMGMKILLYFEAFVKC